MNKNRLIVAVPAMLIVLASCGDSEPSESETTFAAPTVSTAAPNTNAPTTTKPADGSSTDASPESTTENDASTPELCFTLAEGFTIPEEPGKYVASNLSREDVCQFVTQIQKQPETTVIVAELMVSKSGRSFEQIVKQVSEGLEVGKEIDFSATKEEPSESQQGEPTSSVGSLNVPGSGKALSIERRTQPKRANRTGRAVILWHESSRFATLGARERTANDKAFSAVVQVLDPAADPDSPEETTESSPTQYILIWGVSNEVNDKLIVDLIEAMQPQYKTFENFGAVDPETPSTTTSEEDSNP